MARCDPAALVPRGPPLHVAHADSAYAKTAQTAGELRAARAGNSPVATAESRALRGRVLCRFGFLALR